MMTLASAEHSFRSGMGPFLSRRRLAQVAGAVALGAAALLGPASGPASAAEGQAWEIGCAYRQPSGIPGQGQSMLSDRCQSLRFCATMAARGTADLAAMGCFGFDEPRRR